MTNRTLIPLSTLRPGARCRVAHVTRDFTGRAERLGALGVSPGASIVVLQTFPGIVFQCDQTEMAVERRVAGTIYVEVAEEAVVAATKEWLVDTAAMTEKTKAELTPPIEI